MYRMHPLIPDEYSFRSVAGDEALGERTFPELGALHVRERLEEIGVANALYSFGIAHPGAISLHNYPRFLQRLERLTALAWTSPRRTSCGSASAGCRATTSSAGSFG